MNVYTEQYFFFAFSSYSSIPTVKKKQKTEKQKLDDIVCIYSLTLMMVCEET